MACSFETFQFWWEKENLKDWFPDLKKIQIKNIRSCTESLITPLPLSHLPNPSNILYLQVLKLPQSWYFALYYFFVYLYIKWHERIILDDCMWMMPHNNKDVNLIALFEWLLFAREMLNERRTSTQFSLFTRYYLYFHPLYVGISYFGL